MRRASRYRIQESQNEEEDTNLDLKRIKLETNFVNVEENVIIFGGNKIENKNY